VDESTDRCAYADYHVPTRCRIMSKFAAETPWNPNSRFWRLFQRHQPRLSFLWKLLEKASPSKSTAMGHLKRRFQIKAGIRVARAEDPMIAKAIPVLGGRQNSAEQ
jgi:hypothetical protein